MTQATQNRVHAHSRCMDDLLARLHCPYCGSQLDVSAHARTKVSRHGMTADEVSYGVLRCNCHSYPIVEGIPVLQQLSGLDEVVRSIESGDFKHARYRMFCVFRMGWAYRTLLQRLMYRLSASRMSSFQDVSFRQAVRWVRQPQLFADYLFHRYANPSFLASIGTILTLASIPADAGEPVILDLACGAGHASGLMQDIFPNITVIAADQDFTNVYLAKRYMAPQAFYLCIDAELPSPFADATLDGVFCLDAFHYLHSKKAVVAELKRILRPEAIWLFPHLHNGLMENVTAGIPLAPESYLHCFSKTNARLFDESALLTELATRGGVDLSREWEIAELNTCQALTLISGPPQLWRWHGGFAELLLGCKTKLQINPIYRLSRNGCNVRATLRWPNRMMELECRAVQSVLTAQLELDERLTKLSVIPQQLDHHLIDLIGRFALVPLPPTYN